MDVAEVAAGEEDDADAGGCRRVLVPLPRPRPRPRPAVFRVPRVAGTSRSPLEVRLVRVFVGVPGEVRGDDAVDVDVDDGANAGACS